MQDITAQSTQKLPFLFILSFRRTTPSETQLNSTGNKSQVLDRAPNMTSHEVYADFVHTSYLSLASSL